MEQIFLRVFSVSKRYGICFPRSFALLVKQFLYFDRYIQLIAPELDLMKMDFFTESPQTLQKRLSSS